MNRRTTGMVTGTTIAFVLTGPTVAVLAQAPETDSVKYRSITYPQIYCSADGEALFQDVYLSDWPRLMRTQIIGPRSIQHRRVYGLSFQKVGVSTCFDRGFSTPTGGPNDS